MKSEKKLSKPKRKIGTIVLSSIFILISLPILLFVSMVNANEGYPYSMDANKIAQLVGGVFGGFLIATIIGLIIFVIKRYMFKKENNTFMLPFSITLLIVALASLKGLKY